MSNVVLTGPAGSTFATYSVNFDVTGSFLLTSAGNATARGIVGVDDAVGELGSMLASTNASEDGAGGVFQGQTPTASSSFDLAATTENEVGENGSPVTIMLNLATNANVAANDGSGSAAVDFLDPLSFPTHGASLQLLRPRRQSDLRMDRELERRLHRQQRLHVRIDNLAGLCSRALDLGDDARGLRRPRLGGVAARPAAERAPDR
jgi:hypothetical protein